MSLLDEGQSRKNKILHILILFIIIFFMCFIAGMIILVYQVEGEKNAPFDISKVLVMSTAEGIEENPEDTNWNFSVNQNNDIYITIEKKTKKISTIKNVTINNISVIDNPQIGTISYYKPAEEGLFRNDEKYKIDSEIVYEGSKSGSINNLEISNQGGTIIIRFSNENLGQYSTNQNEIISHDGTLLKKLNLSKEQISAKVQFDVIIETEDNIKYKSNILADIPVGNFIEEGTGTMEIEKENIILKRL